MKRNLFLLFLIVSLAGCVTTARRGDFARQVDFTLEMDGFREYKWGTSVEEIGHALIPEGSDERRNIEWFTKKDDPLSIGRANLESITYVFDAGKFVAVSIIANALSNYRALREELEERLGKMQPTKENSFSWDLPHTFILFSYNKQSDVAMVVIRAKGY